MNSAIVLVLKVADGRIQISLPRGRSVRSGMSEGAVKRDPRFRFLAEFIVTFLLACLVFGFASIPAQAQTSSAPVASDNAAKEEAKPKDEAKPDSVKKDTLGTAITK